MTISVFSLLGTVLSEHGKHRQKRLRKELGIVEARHAKGIETLKPLEIP